MRAVSVSVADEAPSVGVDVCPRCYFVWFDASEFEALPAPKRREAEEVKLPLDVRLALAKAEVEALDTGPELRLPPSDPPPEGWKAVPAFFGLPVKHDSRERTRRPIAAWGISLVIALISLFALTDLPRFVQDFGLIPWQPWRYGGLTLLSSFFLHGSLPHLAISLYFLLAFGDDVEEVLGSAQLLLLLALAAIAGGLLHSFYFSASSIPLIGAGAGITGLLTFYGLQYPHARIGYLLRLPVIWFMRWVNVRAWVGVLIWIALQAIGALRQSGGLTQVSLYAHLGGAAMGFLFWFFWPMNRKPSEPRA
jgi:membrane associated rhomboid family serine protease